MRPNWSLILGREQREEEERRREEEEKKRRKKKKKGMKTRVLYGCYDVVWNLLSFVWIAMFLRILGFLI